MSTSGSTIALSCEVLNATNLLPADLSGLADPYVKMYVQPDPNKRTKQKTKVRGSATGCHSALVGETTRQRAQYTTTLCCCCCSIPTFLPPISPLLPAQIVKKSLNPEWNEKFTWKFSADTNLSESRELRCCPPAPRRCRSPGSALVTVCHGLSSQADATSAWRSGTGTASPATTSWAPWPSRCVDSNVASACHISIHVNAAC